MYAFGLQETNLYDKAEKEARRGLRRNEKDGWATHALAHVLEMEGRAQEGIAFMSQTVTDWETSNHLACHNYWHWALYHIERGEYDAASDLLETQIIRRAMESRTMLDIVDASSLLYRLNLTDPSLRQDSDHWDQTLTICRPHLRDHILGFNEAHFMMACASTKNFNMASEILETLEPNEHIIGGGAVVRPLLRAIEAYGREQYAEAVEFLEPIRYQLIDIGGSNAQRDVFNQLLIVAAIKSPSERHRKLAEHLLIERQVLKEDSPLTNRLTLALSSKRP
jgi:tetratricopeptide (TPR) repeat protein